MLKTANVRVEAAVELLQAEALLNERAAKEARAAASSARPPLQRMQSAAAPAARGCSAEAGDRVIEINRGTMR